MKKIFVILIAVLTLLGAFGAHAMVNPWTETDELGMLVKLGFSLRAPAAAQDKVCRVLEAEGLGEARFAWRGVEYTMRAKAAAEFEDISGLNYSAWDTEESCAVRYCEGVFRSVNDGAAIVEACLWYDAAPGIMYSLTAYANENYRTKTVALANVLFRPVQGDADMGEAVMIDALGLLDIMEECCGFEGTAGASLKQAVAAYALLNYAIVNEAATCGAGYLADEYALAAALFSEDEIAEINGVRALVDAAFTDYEAVRGLFDDAGAAAMEELLAAGNAADHWAKLSAVLAN